MQNAFSTARPSPDAAGGAAGLHALQLGARRDALIYAPPHRPAAAPFALMLHGAGGNARHGLSQLQPLADEHGLIVLAPDSRGDTWDLLIGGYGPDVAFLERALRWTFERYAIDARRLAIGGFSDGASYALSLGLDHGELFTHVIAFSPGFAAPSAPAGAPRLFVSHGTRDAVLPIDRCSRRVVPLLRRARYDVDYREFDGPHTVPPEVAAAAVAWFLK
ncbi:MAG TPA: alpha/beta hydrolase-fold protein [Thermoanaerobaculia bacterium]|jgi:phospholipase/carboxylesterase